MNRIVEIVLVGIVFLMMTGCSGFYNSVPKDTVIVKKLEAKEEFKLKSGELLSEETIKTLALNAVSKYFDHHLSLDNVKIELISMEYIEFKTMLASTIRYLNVDQEILDSYLLQLNKASNGLYFVNIKNSFNEYDVYTITINPMDGEILRVAKMEGIFKINKKESPEMLTETLTEEEIKRLAKQYIEQKEIANEPIDLDRIEVRNPGNMLINLYYRSKDGQVLWHLTINQMTKEVLEFSKGVMAVIETTAVRDESNDH